MIEEIYFYYFELPHTYQVGATALGILIYLEVIRRMLAVDVPSLYQTKASSVQPDSQTATATPPFWQQPKFGTLVKMATLFVYISGIIVYSYYLPELKSPTYLLPLYLAPLTLARWIMGVFLTYHASVTIKHTHVRSLYERFVRPKLRPFQGVTLICLSILSVTQSLAPLLPIMAILYFIPDQVYSLLLEFDLSTAILCLVITIFSNVPFFIIRNVTTYLTIRSKRRDTLMSHILPVISQQIIPGIRHDLSDNPHTELLAQPRLFKTDQQLFEHDVLKGHIESFHTIILHFESATIIRRRRSSTYIRHFKGLIAALTGLTNIEAPHDSDYGTPYPKTP